MPTSIAPCTTLSETATAAYEGARRKIQRFINAREEREVIYTRGTTDAVNLVMHGYGRAFLKEGDEIIVSSSSTTPTSCRGRCCAARRVASCA